jgi:polyisoprenoid-binding protein YceI
VHGARPLPEDTTVRYTIETQASRFVVKALSTGLLSALGHSPSIAIRDFSGDVQFSPGAPLENARVLVSIRADSLECIDDIPEKDRLDIHRRMHDEVLETDRFPEIVYECSRVTGSGNGDRYWVALSGELTLHGVTRSLPISARVVVNGDSLRATGDFAFRQTDYDITLVSAAAGTIRVKDELKCKFDIVARKHG